MAWGIVIVILNPSVVRYDAICCEYRSTSESYLSAQVVAKREEKKSRKLDILDIFVSNDE